MRLNREGRPWGVPRSHVNKHGVPKPAKTREEAIGLALQYSYDNAVEPTRRTRAPVGAYECPVAECGAWHVGSVPLMQRRRIARAGSTWAQWYELGDRAWWNLEAENRRSPERRLMAIARRAWAAVGIS